MQGNAAQTGISVCMSTRKTAIVVNVMTKSIQAVRQCTARVGAEVFDSIPNSMHHRLPKLLGKAMDMSVRPPPRRFQLAVTPAVTATWATPFEGRDETDIGFRARLERTSTGGVFVVSLLRSQHSNICSVATFKRMGPVLSASSKNYVGRTETSNRDIRC